MWHLVVVDLKSRHAALMTSILLATDAGDLHPGEMRKIQMSAVVSVEMRPMVTRGRCDGQFAGIV